MKIVFFIFILFLSGCIKKDKEQFIEIENFSQIPNIIDVKSIPKNIKEEDGLKIDLMGPFVHFEYGDSSSLCETTIAMKELVRNIKSVENSSCKLKTLESMGVLADNILQDNIIYLKNNKNKDLMKIVRSSSLEIYQCQFNIGQTSYTKIIKNNFNDRLIGTSYNIFNGSYINIDRINLKDHSQKVKAISYVNNKNEFYSISMNMHIEKNIAKLLSHKKGYVTHLKKRITLDSSMISNFNLYNGIDKENQIIIGSGSAKIKNAYIDSIFSWDGESQSDLIYAKDGKYYNLVNRGHPPIIPSTINELYFEKDQIWNCQIENGFEWSNIDFDLGGEELLEELKICEDSNNYNSKILDCNSTYIDKW